MTQTVIEIENLGKHYRLGEIGGKTLREDVDKWLSILTRKENPLSLISGLNGSQSKGGDIWALRNINLDVKQGEILGIIGHNGAGKSTLLKIMSSITTPTSGSVKIAGRIGSLLEVGTGFHPELTGRENIFLNGAILGMKRTEIRKKMDEIIAFSEIPEFIDTPVKRYSSGMTARLAFAVAAHLEPEIMLVDEVLAVGDAAFQKKCIGKMDEVSNNGKTIIFVSHNLGSIRRLCERLVVLKNGEVIHDGNVDEGIDNYLEDIHPGNTDMPLQRRFSGSNGCFVSSIEVVTHRNNARLFHNDHLQFRICFSTDKSYGDLELNISFWDRDAKLFMLFASEMARRGYNQHEPFRPGEHEIDFSLPTGLFCSGVYHVNITMHRPGDVLMQQLQPAMTFEILDNSGLRERSVGMKRASLNITPVNVEYSQGDGRQ